MTPEQYAALSTALADNGLQIADLTHTMRVVVWWLAALTIVYVVGKGFTVLSQWRDRRDIADLLRVSKEFAQISDMRRAESRNQLKSEIGVTVKESVKEAAAEMTPTVHPPAADGELPVIPIPPTGAVIKPAGGLL